MSGSAENLQVACSQQELMSLDNENGEATVYKLVGPTLIKQDKLEARAAVDRRLEYITRLLDETDKKMEELEKSGEEQRKKLLEYQAKQAQQQQQ
mmetsp:Transcript_42327/g.108953  ORF Transcript_42327/g.108953 Transcript_42327/m.108953 type:complete len:95 (+) Transcript_42327:69-353(+)